jgi:hypothetical protein
MLRSRPSSRRLEQLPLTAAGRGQDVLDGKLDRRRAHALDDSARGAVRGWRILATLHHVRAARCLLASEHPPSLGEVIVPLPPKAQKNAPPAKRP